MKEKKFTILYIDDEPHNLRTFKATFKWEYKILTVQSAFDGFDILENNSIDLIISDQRMAGLSGTEFFKKVIKRYPDPMRIILTGYSELDTILRAVNECGIYRYMTKPWKEAEMKKTIEDTLEVYQLRKDKEMLIQELATANKQLAAENNYLKEEIQQNTNVSKIITKNAKFKENIKLLEQVAPTNASVLIRGETGTGKELMARAIHDTSPRRDKAMIKVNCAALPANLIESELFGHEKGAFTGATQRRIGRFELADGGTIFLDEIGELPIDLQAKLLRVLQEGAFERIGGTETIEIDARVVAATNRDLEKEIEKGNFREDLFYRLNVKAYNYPGNIRELENLIERFMITSPGKVLEVTGWMPTNKELPSSGEHFFTLEEMEIRHIKKALRLSKGKVFGVGGAAEKLGMNAKTLDSRMRKLEINKRDVL